MKSAKQVQHNDEIPKIPKTKYEIDKWYGVKYKGKIRMHINPELVIKQELTAEDVKKIKKIHKRRLKIFDNIEQTSNPCVLKTLVQEVKDVEFELQRAWKMEENADYHTWWFHCPKCTCPKFDNQDAIGVNWSYISNNCPLHVGNKSESSV